MRFAIAICTTFLSFSLHAQAPQELSKQPLSADQIAIYQDYLRSFNANNPPRDPDAKTPVANYTSRFGPAELPDAARFHDCLKSFASVDGSESIHMLPEALLPRDMQLVDPVAKRNKDRQTDKVQAPGAKPPNPKAEPIGYLTLSEIIFSPDHKLAAFRENYYCGNVCGTGGFVVYERENDRWTQSGSLHCAAYIAKIVKIVGS